MNSNFSRRSFLQTAIAGAPATQITIPFAHSAETQPSGPRLKKGLKFGAVEPGSTLQEKFDIVKECGFLGVELDSPSAIDKDAALAASRKSGIEIHGVVDSIHWQKRLSDPDEKVRAEGVAALQQALKDTKFYGGTTVLLVPGRVTKDGNETFEQAWERSQIEIRKAIPTAQETGVKIAIEVVWNDFITKPEQLVKYVDEFKSEYVGAYFDISNMIKYGVPPADWIRALGPRMLKFDFKGYKHDGKPPWVKIGEGDENWPEVLKALDEIGYRGWATCEVSLPTKEELKDVSSRMDKVLGL